MNTIILSLFKNPDDAVNASKELLKNGIDSKNISIIMKDEAKTVDEITSTDKAPKGAAAGAATGGVIGGIAGLLVGIGAITIPGIGAVLVGGPLITALGLTGATATAATTIAGSISGAMAGGLIGALVGLGIPEDEAQIYEKSIKEGSVLLAVMGEPGQEGTIKNILISNQADEIRGIDSDRSAID